MAAAFIVQTQRFDGSLYLSVVVSGGGSCPMEQDKHIYRVLWTEEEISDRVAQLGRHISDDFAGLSSPLVVIGVATGAFMFLADLVRKITLPVIIDIVRVQSYGDQTESNGAPQIFADIKVNIEGKHVLLVEDIIDTGITLSCLLTHIMSKGAASVSVCVFLDKVARRKIPLKLREDGKVYRGFECPDSFVVGYGMDYADLYRSLPYIGILKPEIYK